MACISLFFFNLFLFYLYLSVSVLRPSCLCSSPSIPRLKITIYFCILNETETFFQNHGTKSPSWSRPSVISHLISVTFIVFWYFCIICILTIMYLMLLCNCSLAVFICRYVCSLRQHIYYMQVRA